MKIKILYFDPISDGSHKAGHVDFSVEYQHDKWETFRGCMYFKKENKKWISPGVVKRGDKFLQRYERNPSFGKIVPEVVKELEDYISSHDIIATNEISLPKR